LSAVVLANFLRQPTKRNIADVIEALVPSAYLRFGV